MENHPIDKRQWLRINRKIEVHVAILDSKPSADTFFLDQVWTKDISVNGVGLITSYVCAAGSRMTLKFQLPNKVEPVNIVGRVMWSRPVSSGSTKEYRTGISFESIHPADRAAILDFVHDDTKQSMSQKATGGGQS